MKYLLVLLLSLSAYAHDGPENVREFGDPKMASIGLLDNQSFDWIQPFDNKVRAIVEWDNKELAADLSDKLELVLIPLPVIYSLTSGGDTWEKTKVVATIEVLNGAITYLAKIGFDRTRPSGSKKSFWSGHTSSAFTSAGLMCSIAPESLCIGSLVLATTTGYLRMAGGKHWFSDVLVGATVGYSQGIMLPALVFNY